MTTLRSRGIMLPGSFRISELASEDKERKFFSIAHLLTPEALCQAFESLRKDASAGVDEVTYAEYCNAPRFIPVMFSRYLRALFSGYLSV